LQGTTLLNLCKDFNIAIVMEFAIETSNQKIFFWIVSLYLRLQILVLQHHLREETDKEICIPTLELITIWHQKFTLNNLTKEIKLISLPQV